MSAAVRREEQRAVALVGVGRRFPGGGVGSRRASCNAERVKPGERQAALADAANVILQPRGCVRRAGAVPTPNVRTCNGYR